MSADDSMGTIAFPKASTVVLTGAGFSVPAGLPVTNQLVSRGRERLGVEVTEALDALTCEILGEPVGEDIEAVLTRLRVLELYSKKYDYVKEIFPVEMGIYFLIWVALLRSSNQQPLGVYNGFLERLGNDVAFASLNYDLILETIFRRQQRAWHYALQGETNFYNQLSYRENFYASLDQDPHSIAYLKLHGSFNWHYCWRCNYFRIVRDEYFGVSDFHLPRRDRDPLWVTSIGTLMCSAAECLITSGPGVGQAALKPLIIPPARLKEYSRAPIWRQWAIFDLLLAQAEKLILVGTSIRDEDVLLFNSLSLLKFKNPSLERVVVINRDEEITKKVGLLTEVETASYRDLEEYLERG